MKTSNIFVERGFIMGIGILIVVIGSLIYKGRDKVQKIFHNFTDVLNEKTEKRPRS